MISVNTMIKQLEGLADTADLTQWETDFVTSLAEKTDHGRETRALTARQVEMLERLHRKHFAVY